ncbi:hypothetical protein [Amorphus orientalis]|uniref:Uncharacterized protein n=1 Tax=Amorphus orientalis TaxID=649198 RepID=A0AAE3VT91_9HYPH|nr:hypothetical protein [Amorphus orientalis]MDQ0317738.1 hypothetical protein [Amorphus orientalis]
MTDWFNNSIPWWTLAIGGGALTVVAWVYLGRKAATALAVAVFLAVVDRRARQAGWEARDDLQKRREEDFVDDYRDHEKRSRARSESELDRRNNRWLRD